MTCPLTLPLQPLVERHVRLTLRERQWRKHFGLSYNQCFGADGEGVLTRLRLTRSRFFAAVRPRGVG